MRFPRRRHAGDTEKEAESLFRGNGTAGRRGSPDCRHQVKPRGFLDTARRTVQRLQGINRGHGHSWQIIKVELVLNLLAIFRVPGLPSVPAISGGGVGAGRSASATAISGRLKCAGSKTCRKNRQAVRQFRGFIPTQGQTHDRTAEAGETGKRPIAAYFLTLLRLEQAGFEPCPRSYKPPKCGACLL